MTDKKEQGRKRKAAYDAKQKAGGRGRLEITPPPKLEYHESIKAQVREHIKDLDNLNNIDDNKF
jgi:hypothetical protein